MALHTAGLGKLALTLREMNVPAFFAYYLVTPYPQAMDFVRTIVEPFYDQCNSNVTSEAIAQDDLIQNEPLSIRAQAKALGLIFRFPYLVGSCVYAIKGIGELCSYFHMGESGAVGIEALESFAVSAGAFCTASSMYLKDSDPRLLNKTPLKDKVIGWVKNKVSLLAPQIEPKPVPVEASYSAINS